MRFSFFPGLKELLGRNDIHKDIHNDIHRNIRADIHADIYGLGVRRRSTYLQFTL